MALRTRQQDACLNGHWMAVVDSMAALHLSCWREGDFRYNFCQNASRDDLPHYPMRISALQTPHKFYRCGGFTNRAPGPRRRRQQQGIPQLWIIPVFRHDSFIQNPHSTGTYVRIRSKLMILNFLNRSPRNPGKITRIADSALYITPSLSSRLNLSQI